MGCMIGQPARPLGRNLVEKNLLVGLRPVKAENAAEGTHQLILQHCCAVFVAQKPIDQHERVGDVARRRDVVDHRKYAVLLAARRRAGSGSKKKR